VEFLTCNDYVESTYMDSWRSDDPVIYMHPVYHQVLLDHSGFRYFSKRYVQWFKTGVEPAITEDELYYAYRLHPRNAASFFDLGDLVKDALKQWTPDGANADSLYRKDALPTLLKFLGGSWNLSSDWTRLSDGIHVAVRLKEPADVYINGVKVGDNLPAGEHLLVKPGAIYDGPGKLGYPLYTFGTSDFGKPTFEIRRRGQTVIAHTGELEITPYCAPGNWNIFARRAPGPSSSSQPPPSSSNNEEAPTVPETPAIPEKPSVSQTPPATSSPAPDADVAASAKSIRALKAADVGSPARAGSTSLDANSSTAYWVSASGTDIWGTSDEFNFSQATFDGDAGMTVRVNSIENTDGWAKAGLMFRASDAADAAHVSVFATASSGIAMQTRNRSGASSVNAGAVIVSTPVWLRLTRAGDVFTASYSADGANWQQLGTTSVSLPQSMLGGLAATSHNADANSVVSFDHLTTTSAAAPAAGVAVSIAGGNTSKAPDGTVTFTPALSGDTSTLSRVEFFDGDTKVGEATSAPWTFQWNSAVVGVHSITAKATTGSGVSSVSAPLSVIVDSVPLAPPPPSARSVISNLSTRGRTAAGDETMITGFVVDGSTPRTVLVRGVGPTLARFGVSGALSSVHIELYHGNKLIGSSDGWSAQPNATAIASAATSAQAFSLPVGSGDAALLVTLEPGVYTVHASGANGAGGEVLIETFVIHDPSEDMPGGVGNLSTRARIGSGNTMAIAGFSIFGDAPKRVLLRGIGPALSAFGVNGVLPDPQMKVFKDGVLLAVADDWDDNPSVTDPTADIMASTGAFPLAKGSKDAVLILDLPPGAYTVQVFDKNNASGTALVEVYEVE
jgi:regulation of enolase protein 1 (concanavalin A-like superfamily)